MTDKTTPEPFARVFIDEGNEPSVHVLVNGRYVDTSWGVLDCDAIAHDLTTAVAPLQAKAELADRMRELILNRAENCCSTPDPDSSNYEPCKQCKSEWSAIAAYEALTKAGEKGT